jgi:hypothetical protein
VQCPPILLYLISLLIYRSFDSLGRRRGSEQWQEADVGSKKMTSIKCIGSDHSRQIFTGCQLCESSQESPSQFLCKRQWKLQHPPSGGALDLNSSYLEIRKLASKPYPFRLQRKLNARSLFNFWEFKYTTTICISPLPYLAPWSASQFGIMHNLTSSNHTILPWWPSCPACVCT